MSYGGPTWDTAGVLTLGATNTFDPADATESGPFGLQHAAWWTFTTTGELTRLTVSTFLFVLYKGDTYAERVTVSADDFDGDDTLYRLPAGTYHLVVGHFGTAPASYAVTYAQTLFNAHTSWLGTFRDRDDNVLVIGSADLLPENPWSEWTFAHAWYDALLSGVEGERAPGRRAIYQIQDVLFGTPLLPDAPDCAWGHVVHGDNGDFVTYWNGSTTDVGDTSAPACRPLGEGLVDEQATDEAYSLLAYSPPSPPFVAGRVLAEAHIAAFSPALRYARDNLTERGALPFPLADPVADGVPAEYAADAILEWHPDDELELLSVEITGDDQGADYDADSETTFLVNPDIGPTYAGGGTFTSWSKGIPSATLGFTYQDGVDWHDVPDITSFDDLADEGPDMVIASAMTVALNGAAPTTEQTNASRVGYRLTFRSPRYRWTWISTETTTPGEPPLRLRQRGDSKAGGADRVRGRGRAAGNRVHGRIR